MAIYFSDAAQTRAAHVINVTRCENTTRTVISESTNSGRVLCDFGNVNKLHASSILVAHGHIHGWGDRANGIQLNIKSGSSNTNINDNYSGGTSWLYPNCCHQHANDNNSRQINFDGMLTGYTTTGNSSLIITHRSANDSGQRPFTIINPNASDHGSIENSMSGSVAIVYEILL